MHVLFVVATPIGNLEDISLRALRTLREVRLIAAEDTRKTRRLLAAYDIGTPMTSFHEHTRSSKIPRILERLDDGDIALVTEAGMPGISDPGYELVVAAIQQGRPVVPIPGPSAVTAALAVSGLPAERFTCLGFLPSRAGARRKLLETIAHETNTLVVFEAPHRLLASLADIRTLLGDRQIAVCREMTKLHEQVFRGAVSQAMERFAEPRGEFTLVIEGTGVKDSPGMTADVERQIGQLRRSGLSARDTVARMAAETGIARKDLYRAWLREDAANQQRRVEGGTG